MCDVISILYPSWYRSAIIRFVFIRGKAQRLTPCAGAGPLARGPEADETMTVTVTSDTPHGEGNTTQNERNESSACSRHSDERMQRRRSREMLTWVASSHGRAMHLEDQLEAA